MLINAACVTNARMKSCIFLFILGAFAALSMAPTNFWPALFLGLSGLYVCLERSQSWKRSALFGFFFSLGYFGCSLSWIGNALLVEDNPYRWAWPLAVSGLPLILSCFTAIATAGHFFVRACRFPAFVILMTMAELARGHLFTGFPWNLYGYTWIEVKPIAQVAGFYNIYLLSALTIFWASTPALLSSCKTSKKQKIVIVLCAFMSFAACYIYGLKRIQNAVPQDLNVSVLVVQPNIKQSEKWDRKKRQDHFMNLIELSRYKGTSKERAHIILWPETAIAQDVLNAPWAMNVIRETLKAYPHDVFLITGVLRYEDEKLYNSVVTFNKNADIINIYDKSHLVPFGEYMPLSHIFDIAPIVGFTGFQKGRPPHAVKLSNQLSFLPLICYEIIFPGHAGREVSMILNVTNDAWYGDSAGPYQHLVQAQFRAIESHSYVFRSANTGISAAINPLGYIENAQALSTKGYVVY